MKNEYDIVIIGGGMVGASMACALEHSGYSIAVVEPYSSESGQQPSFDERTVALTWSSRLIFNAIGVWQDIQAEAWPILDIEVTSQDSFGLTTLGTEDTDTGALGYVVPTRCIGQVLHAHLLGQDNVDFLCPARVESMTPQPGQVQLRIRQQELSSAAARLVILADGGRSGLLDSTHSRARSRRYPQSALAAIVCSDRPHQGKAYEHFTTDGPLALLPVRESDYALAWTLLPEAAEHLSGCGEAEFLDRLQSAFGRRAGQFTSVGRRGQYPLSLSVLDTPIRQRTVIIGNAAHTVHPVAGQGFNLGLRDAGYLHQVLAECEDPGDRDVLERYAALRTRDTRAVSSFTDGLIRIFTSEDFAVQLGRNLGLSAINLLPPLKRALLKRTMGLHGRQSRLAMQGRNG